MTPLTDNHIYIYIQSQSRSPITRDYWRGDSNLGHMTPHTEWTIEITHKDHILQLEIKFPS